MKKKITITIDAEIENMLKEHLINLKVGNKSKFVEELIKKEIDIKNKK
jgi:hypothetical protein